MSEIYDKCVECGNIWGDDGCLVSNPQGVEVEYFVCENCHTPTTEEMERVS